MTSRVATDVTAPASSQEGGYLLVAAGFVVLALGGMAAGLAFDSWRSARYQSNYMLGQQFAETAIVAHNNAQRDFYADDAFNPGDVAIPQFPLRLNGIEYTLRAVPVQEAPFDPGAFHAASALLFLHPVTSTGQVPLASDMAAFADGAASRGMKDIAVMGATIPSDGALCGADVTALRWGKLDDPDPAKCMTPNDLATLGIAPQAGDIIVPVWEVAIARMDTRALMRYPQPGREELTEMEADLLIGSGATISGVGNVETATLAVNDQGEIQNISANGAATLNNVSTSNMILNGGLTQDSQDAGTAITFNNLTAPTVDINDSTSSGQMSEIAVSNMAAIVNPIEQPQLVLSGIDAPLQLTVTQINATDTDIQVLNGITAQTATFTSCEGNCPQQ